MTDNDVPGAGPLWTPGARLAIFIKRTSIHCYSQNIKAPGIVVLEIFFVCPVVSLWELITPEMVPFFPRGMIRRICVSSK